MTKRDWWSVIGDRSGHARPPRSQITDHACLLLIMLALATPTFAQLEMGGRYIGTIHHETKSAGNTLELGTCQGFAAFAEKFWSERTSTRIEARFLQPAVFLQPADIDLGTLGVEPVALTMRYHLAPRAWLSPYVGAGAAYVHFGNLDDQNADDIDVQFDSEIAPVGEAGVRWRVRERIFFDFGITYMPIEANADIRRSNGVVLPDQVTIHPLVYGAAASWRF
ncbi:MAG TPA: OmpW family outer membrane protein [Thermoanaerobaculia bacterium]|nr:OmpW family outer membrane protein [Thermoanaerobaculia bacterium]